MDGEESKTSNDETIELESEQGAVEGETLLELVLAEHAERADEKPLRIEGVLVGRLVAIGASGEPMVAFPGSEAAGRPARAMASFSGADTGRRVALLFEQGDPDRPVVMGFMHEPSPDAAAEPAEEASAEAPAEVEKDGERLEFTAEREIVLRCGKASITLTRAGKIILRGAYLLARSSGVNRIQGGSVQIN